MLNLSFITPKMQILRDFTSNELSRVKIRQPVEIIRTCIRTLCRPNVNEWGACCWLVISSTNDVMFLPLFVCLFACLSVTRISQKVLHGFI